MTVPNLQSRLQIPELVRSLTYRGSSDTLKKLKELREILALGREAVEAFIQVPEAIELVRDHISSIDSAVQLEAMYVFATGCGFCLIITDFACILIGNDISSFDLNAFFSSVDGAL